MELLFEAHLFQNWSISSLDAFQMNEAVDNLGDSHILGGVEK